MTAIVGVGDGAKARWTERLARAAATPWGMVLLCTVAFAEASVFLIPPEVLLFPLVLLRPQRAWVTAAACTVSSVAGGAAGYAIGATAWSSVSAWFFASVPGFTPDRYDLVAGLFAEHGVLIIFIAGFTPIPYKVFTVVGGAAGMAFVPFVLASLVGRGLRYFLLTWLVRSFGPRVIAAFERRLAWVTVGFCIVAAAAFWWLRAH